MPYTAAPARMLAREPHRANWLSQLRSCWISAPPGMPAAVGVTVTSAKTRKRRSTRPPAVGGGRSAIRLAIRADGKVDRDIRRRCRDVAFRQPTATYGLT